MSEPGSLASPAWYPDPAGSTPQGRRRAPAERRGPPPPHSPGWGWPRDTGATLDAVIADGPGWEGPRQLSPSHLSGATVPRLRQAGRRCRRCRPRRRQSAQRSSHLCSGASRRSRRRGGRARRRPPRTSLPRPRRRGRWRRGPPTGIARTWPPGRERRRSAGSQRGPRPSVPTVALSGRSVRWPRKHASAAVAALARPPGPGSWSSARHTAMVAQAPDRLSQTVEGGGGSGGCSG